MSTIRFERREGIGSIVLANPPFNRVDAKYSSLLREAVHAASESDIRVLVVRAEGPNFSLGGEVREWPGKDVNWFRTFVAEVNASYRAIEALRVPTVAAVRGLAFGGGFELALACDFLVAAENAVPCCRSPAHCNVWPSVSVARVRRDFQCWASPFQARKRARWASRLMSFRTTDWMPKPMPWRVVSHPVRRAPTQRLARC